MSMINSPGIVTSGLLFCYDMNNTKKSFKGAPTTNYAYTQNPRIDTKYDSYSITTSGTWPAKHSDAIRVYNIDGSEITGYVNTGVGDWTNTYHAIWTYDRELEKPVVTMRDIGNGDWLAKSFGLPNSFSTWGLSNGSQYTISWLQWTDNISKSANAGIYRYSTSNGYWNFWDGQSNSQSTSFNTKPRTWERVYATFSVSASADIGSGISCYMYGMYGPRGTVKIADVQIEPLGYATGFHNALTRTNTQAILDQVGANVITSNSVTYASNGTFSFDGSSGHLTLGSDTNLIKGNAITVEAWVRTNVTGVYKKIFTNGNATGVYLSIGPSPYNTYFGVVTNGTSGGATWTTDISTTAYTHLVGVYNGATCILYANGVQVASGAASGVMGTGSTVYVSGYASGSERWNGQIPSLKVYSRALSLSEVRQNFNALRGRYGL